MQLLATAAAAQSAAGAPHARIPVYIEKLRDTRTHTDLHCAEYTVDQIVGPGQLGRCSRAGYDRGEGRDIRQGRYCARGRRAREGRYPSTSMILEMSHPVFSSRDFLTLPLRLPTIPPPDRLLLACSCLLVRACVACYLLALARVFLHCFVILLGSGLSFSRCLDHFLLRALPYKHNLGSICRAVPSLPCSVRLS